MWGLPGCGLSNQRFSPILDIMGAKNLAQARYSTKWTTILTMIGMAVGLGNVWRFPYMMGSYGGSAFLVIFLIFTLLFAIPALIAELTLGKMSGKGTVDAFRIALGSHMGAIVGYFLLGVITVAGSYYAVVVANVIYTTGFSVIFGFSDQVGSYNLGLYNGWMQYGITLFLITLSMVVLHKGLTAGIEWVSKFFMPIFWVAVIYLIIHALTLPNAISQFKTFLQPDLSALSSREIFAALGQAFFSVGLGGTFIITYAAYLRPQDKPTQIAIFTGLGDLSASLMVSLFLIPTILVFGVDFTSGPGLIFETFPSLFGLMPQGRWVGSLFLISLSLVAFLSLVAAYNVPYFSLKNEWKGVGKKRLLVVLGTVQAILALPSSLNPHLIGVLDLIFGAGMQVLGSLLAILGITWGIKHFDFKGMLNHWLKWFIPLTLFSVLLGYIYSLL